MHVKNDLSFIKSALVYLISFSIAFYFPYTSYALQDDGSNKQPKIAVLDFKGKNIEPVDAEIITSQFRTALFNTGRYIILDRALVLKILEKFDYAAAGICDVECAVNIGENLDTDKVITGEVSHLGELYLINIQMVDIDSASLEVADSFHEKCALEDLPLLMPEIVEKFIKKVDEIKIAGTAKEAAKIPEELEKAEKLSPEPVGAAQNGKVKVKTIPEGAEVTANGKLLGISPFDPQELAAGKYTFVAKKQGYIDAGMEIEILPDWTTEVLLSLKSVEAAASPEAVQQKEIAVGTEEIEKPDEISTVETEKKELELAGAVRNGKAIIKTIPEGAVVTANGKFFGISPFEPKELAPGKYNFVAKKKGYTDAGMEIEILSEKTTELLLSLKPIQVVASPEAEKPEEEKGGGAIWFILGGIVVVGVVAALLLSGGDKGSAPTTGTLVINNNLGFSVQATIDGSSSGTISAGSSQSKELSVGTHTVKLTSINTTGTSLASSPDITTSPDPVSDSRRPGSRIKNSRRIRTNAGGTARTINNLNAYSKTYTVNITGGETTTINHGNDWDNGDLYIISTPSGASIWLDGTDTGKTTPSRIDEVSPSSHTVICKKTGYEDKSETVTVISGQTTNLSLTLSPMFQWITIPSGCYYMGDNFNEGSSDERPVHMVCISSFQMNKYEVTNFQYKQCVDAGRCLAPGSSSSYSRSSYYENPAYYDYPVIYVYWNQARNYCFWKGGRLPTEAEWEYAGRGGLNGKKYPWGDSIDSTRANYNQNIGDTTSAGAYPSNGYGLYDMAGNVWEYVNDWYSSSYYSESPKQDPQGPSSGVFRLVRGGSWDNNSYSLRIAERLNLDSSSRNYYYGIRCVK